MENINKVATDATLTEQDQSWELMSVLGMKWTETLDLTEEDKKFLLAKVEHIKVQMKAQAQSINP